MLNAAIIGCGRIAAGIGDWPRTPYIYTHAEAYLALKDRVQLRWMLDKQGAIGLMAYEKFKDHGVGAIGGGDWRIDLRQAMLSAPAEIVSVCVPPAAQVEVVAELAKYPCIKGAWIEKPFMLKEWPKHWKINVNYIRRADALHRELEPSPFKTLLRVKAKKDIHTVCHFTDLARFWHLGKHRFEYTEFDGPCSYELELNFIVTTKLRVFNDGGVTGGFMEAMLGNLLDAVEGKAELWSPPDNAVESEKWAKEILESK